MYIIINKIWNLANNDWRKKIISSGLISFIIFIFANKNTITASAGWANVVIMVFGSFVFGSFIALYLLVGGFLNLTFNDRESAYNRIVVVSACLVYALSLVPFAISICIIIYKLII